MASKRDTLIKAAKKLLWERGYEATSPRDIQDASGAGQGSFYHHFDGKLDLAAVAIGEIAEDMIASTSTLFAGDTRGIERVAAFLLVYRDGLKGCKLGRFAAEVSIGEPSIRGPVKGYFDQVELLLATALEDAVLEKDIILAATPQQVAAMLIAVLQGGFVLSRIHRDKDAINRATATALSLLRSTITKC